MKLIISSIALSLLALLVSRWMAKKNPGKSSLLTAGMMILLLLLPLTMFMPKVNVILPWMSPAAPSSLDATAQVAQSTPLLPIILLTVWITGAVFLIGRLISHQFAVRSWLRDAAPCIDAEMNELLIECADQVGLPEAPTLVTSRAIESPVVTGLLRPTILLPESSKEWSLETTAFVLLHELGHVKRKDLWLSVASHIVCAIHWFNPLIWTLRKHHVALCEFACDTYVLETGANPKRYINALCDVAEATSNQHRLNNGIGSTLALAMANKATLRQRVECLLQDNKPSGHWLTLSVLLGSAVSGFALNMIVPKGPLGEQKPDVHIAEEQPVNGYSKQEIETRLTANPFPEDE